MKKLNIIYGCLLFVLLVSMCSCGARKVAKSETKEETHSIVSDNSTSENKSEANVKTTTTEKTDDKNETVTEETIYEPKDPAKESFVIEKDGTKTVLNNAKKTVKKTTQKNNTQSELIGNSEQLKKEASKEQKYVKQSNASVKKENSKQVDKKQFNPLNLILISLGALVLLYVIYILYKKFMLQ